MCNDWDANSGGNLAVLVDGPVLSVVDPPEGAEVLLGGRIGAAITPSDNHDYFEASKAWAATSGRPTTEVIGQAGNAASWLQADETPNCSCCEKPMRFLAQIEEPPFDTGCAMNFGGGGSAYQFVCASGERTAKFLWQC